MGIDNINFLINPDPPNDPVLQAQAAQQQRLVDAHRRGEHPQELRDCPLCQLRQ